FCTALFLVSCFALVSDFGFRILILGQSRREDWHAVPIMACFSAQDGFLCGAPIEPYRPRGSPLEEQRWRPHGGLWQRRLRAGHEGQTRGGTTQALLGRGRDEGVGLRDQRGRSQLGTRRRRGKPALSFAQTAIVLDQASHGLPGGGGLPGVAER